MKYQLHKNPIHLGLNATAVAQPDFTGMPWYEDYAQRNREDGAEGRLVALHSFSQPWDMWEMHPKGHEVVFCISGEITLIQETPQGEIKIKLRSGEYAINPPGVWHTADVQEDATALFITAGEGTEHRSR